MWPLKTILYFAMFWVACLLALVNPIWGVVNYLFAYQIHPVGTWWGEPLAAMGMRFSMLAAVFTILGMFFGRKRVPAARPLFSLWELGVLALLCLAALNTVLGVVYSHHSRFALEKLWKMLIFVLLLTRLGSDRRNMRLILWTFVLGSLYLGHDAFTSHRSDFYFGRLNRVGGPDFATTSGLAAHLSAMLPIIGIAFLITNKWKWKALAAVSGAFTVNAIIMCRTRSAFIGLAFGAVVALLMAPRARRYRIHVLLVAGAVSAFSLTDNYFWDRVHTLTDVKELQHDPAAVSRADIWEISLRILSDYPQGIGVGNFTSVIGTYEPAYKYRATHNTVLVCFVELGVCGGIVFLLMATGSLVYIWRATRLADLSDRPLETKLIAYGLLVSVVTYFVTGLGTERFYCESFWWILALPLPLYRFLTQEAKAAITAVEPSFSDAEGKYVPAGGVQYG